MVAGIAFTAAFVVFWLWLNRRLDAQQREVEEAEREAEAQAPAEPPADL